MTAPEATVAPHLMTAQWGAKAASLALLDAEYPGLVPEFVVMPLEQLLTVPLPAVIDLEDADAVAAARAARVDEAALARLLGTAHAWPLVAVRTSALAEDGAHRSFAGLYQTVLDVRPADLVAAVRTCVASLVSERVLAYARAEGMAELPVGGSVVVQRMVHAPRHGVMFTLTGTGDLEVAWSAAGPDAVVRGEDAATFRLPAVEPLPRRRRASRTVPVPRRLLEVGRDLQRRRGATDVEFACSGGRVWLLQARPITAHDRTSMLAWDSSNIGENYPGLTLPLTYSFIRDVYAHVYPAFFRLLGTDEAQLRAADRTFRNTLGYVRGRVHYQIDNWFEMAAMLPGGRANQEFFAAMLQPVKAGKARQRVRPGLKGAVALAAGGVRLGWLLATSERRSRRFVKTYNERFTRYDAVQWEALSATAALAALGHMRTDLLALWATPILNDVRLMVAHGLLRRTFTATQHAEYLAFLTGLTDRASLAPLKGLAELGVALRAEGIGTADDPLGEDARAHLAHYLAVYGGRAPEELQLENPRLGDDEATLVALALHAADAPPQMFDRASERPTGTLWQRVVGAHVRRAIDHRERFRYFRAQVFGLARAAYVRVGEALADAGELDSAADVFWLTIEEVDAAVFGHAWGPDLAALVAARRARQAEYASDVLPRRVVGAGPIAPASLDLTGADAGAPGTLAGMGVSPGEVTADVVVLPVFDAHADVRGKVLVTSHVDPGWTLLLVAAGAIVTERGNALSHVAIIGRELGIPVVVAAPGAVAALSAARSATVNGTTGQVWAHE